MYSSNWVLRAMHEPPSSPDNLNPANSVFCFVVGAGSFLLRVRGEFFSYRSGGWGRGRGGLLRARRRAAAWTSNKINGRISLVLRRKPCLFVNLRSIFAMPYEKPTVSVETWISSTNIYLFRQ